MTDMRRGLPPILRDKHYDSPSTFTPESLLREARRQKNIPHVPIPEVCVLNPDGDIVGRYTLAGVSHGYLLSAGQFTTIDFPGALNNAVREINPRGDVLGDYNYTIGEDHGFLLSREKPDEG